MKTNRNTSAEWLFTKIVSARSFYVRKKMAVENRGNSQHLERPWKKVYLIVMMIRPVNSGMPYKPI